MPSETAASIDPVIAFIGNVGGGEVLVILIIALIVLGPQRLPDAAKSIGKAMGELRRASTGFQNEIRSVIDDTSIDVDAQTRARNNVLQKEEPADPTDDAGGATADAAAAVSQQASRPRRPRRTTPLQAEPDPGDAEDGEQR
jgi:Tat protein translocase TatB subunit